MLSYSGYKLGFHGDPIVVANILVSGLKKWFFIEQKDVPVY